MTLTAFALSVVDPRAEPPVPVHVKLYVYVPADAGVTVWVPNVDCEPVHAPPAVHTVALVVDQVNAALLPSVIAAGLTLIETFGALGVPAEFTVSVADACAAPPEAAQLSR